MTWILNLKLRIKLLLAFGSILLLSIFMMLKAFQTMRVSDAYQQTSETIDGVSLNVLQIDGALKYFISEGYKEASFQKERKSKYLDLYHQQLQQSSEKLLSLKADELIKQDSAIQKIEFYLQHINVQAQSLSGLLKERGFKDFGLEGDLRKAIHQVENSTFPYDKATLLMLRRHEKDFFLRKDLKYHDEFNRTLDAFTATIANSSYPDKEEILGLLKNYRSKFNLVVSIEQKIGLQSGGIKEIIATDLELVKKEVMQVRESVKVSDKQFHEGAWTLLGILFTIQLIAGIGMAVIYADQITRPVKQLQQAIQHFASGTLPEKLPVKSTEEIGQTKRAFNQLIDRIQAAQDFSLALGDGRLDSHYDDRYTGDLLAQSLTRMQEQLLKARKEQQIINWNNFGSAQLNEILKSENENISALGDRLIKMLVTYLEANQGVLFLIGSDGTSAFAERISTYAYSKKKFIDQRIEAGQGIVGQCILEKSTILLKQVPKNYIQITSGLGEAVPSFIIVVPLLVREELLGIIEIASFKSMADYQISFLEKISENIASILYSKKSADETRKLLEEARERAEELMAQEEEIRQNAEEMQAITEQLEREKKMMQSEVELLRAQLAENLPSRNHAWSSQPTLN